MPPSTPPMRPRFLPKAVADALRSPMSPATGLLVVAMALGLAAGCAEKEKYEVLSFFFDGVPVPEGVEVDEPQAAAVDNWNPPLDINDPRAQRILAARDLSEDDGPQAFFLHTPFARRDCFGCHTRERSMTAPQKTADLCKSCHEDYFQYARTDWVHGPAAVGQCAMCHEAHKSEYPGLLSRPQPDVCLDCHDQTRLLSAPYHAAAAAGEQLCSHCHDPHEAGNRLFLVDSQSYERRKDDPVISMHPRDDVGCANCHPAELSNQVIENVDQVCASCHTEHQGTFERYHAQGQATEPGCTACHTPHRSSKPHLLRTNAEKACLNCHDLADINQNTHPKMWRADCLLCHKGHESDRPDLLRPGIPQTVWQDADSRAPAVAARDHDPRPMP